MKPGHVPLLREKWPTFGRENRKSLVSSLPFYERDGDGYVHIVRSGSMHYRNGRFSHTSISFWCGQSGFLEPAKGRKPARLLEAPSPGREVCATCIGRSLGAGQSGNPNINGQAVRFTPRAKFMHEKVKP